MPGIWALCCDQQMKTDFTGTWECVRSNIPDYVPGGEWLHFSADEEHVWEIAQPNGKGRPSVNRFILKVDGDAFRYCPINRDSGEVGEGWRIVIEKLSAQEITVTPHHGFTSIFRLLAGENRLERAVD